MTVHILCILVYNNSYLLACVQSRDDKQLVGHFTPQFQRIAKRWKGMYHIYCHCMFIIYSIDMHIIM